MAAGSVRYSAPAIILHWLIALLMCCGFGLGLYMVELRFSPQKLTLYSYHKWIGVTVFTLALLRLLWRFTHRPPSLPASVAPWQQAASGAIHLLLYLLMLGIPLSGWLYSSATGVPTVPLGIAALQLPDLVVRDRDLAVSLKFVHLALNYSLAGLVVLHVGAALKHQFFDRDGIMLRMLPGCPIRS